MIPAGEALARLREGNRRFVAGIRAHETLATQAHRSGLLERQRPFAVILGCSDSRVPVEVVFDQGLGDLFVIRVAGNVAAPSQIGSVEFAADRCGSRLVVVLGHTRCGAIAATVSELLEPTGDHSHHLRSITDVIAPVVESLLATELRHDPEALARAAVRANVRAAMASLRHGSAILARLIREEGLLIVGAEYSLESGEVEFLAGADEVPPGSPGSPPGIRT